jgi:hypothetical protein
VQAERLPPITRFEARSARPLFMRASPKRFLWNLDPSGRLICCVRIDRIGLSMCEERCSVGQLSGSELTCADLRPALTTQPLTANRQS